MIFVLGKMKQNNTNHSIKKAPRIVPGALSVIYQTKFPFVCLVLQECDSV